MRSTSVTTATMQQALGQLCDAVRAGLVRMSAHGMTGLGYARLNVRQPAPTISKSKAVNAFIGFGLCSPITPKSALWTQTYREPAGQGNFA